MGTGEGGKPSGRNEQKPTNPPRKRSAGASQRYLITVVGEIPFDIDERVSTAHASAISANRAAPDVLVPAASRPRKGV